MENSKDSLNFYYSKFSEASKILLAKTRLVAIELGFNYICETHFIIADCQLNKSDSIQDFIFPNDGDLKNFINKNRKENQTVLPEFENRRLPLTRNTEEMIRKSFYEAGIFKSKKIEPFHMFLSACKVENFMFSYPNKTGESIYNEMISYYKKKGILLKEETSNGFKKSIAKIFKRNN